MKFRLGAPGICLFLNGFSWQVVATFRYSSCSLLPEASLSGRLLTNVPPAGRRAENHQGNPYCGYVSTGIDSQRNGPSATVDFAVLAGVTRVTFASWDDRETWNVADGEAIKASVRQILKPAWSTWNVFYCLS